MDVAYRTDVGKIRQKNEDAVLTLFDSNNDIFVCAVADGMGGHKGGGMASSTALNILRKKLISLDGHKLEEYVSSLEEIITSINDEILEQSNKDSNLKGMGTTITACIVNKNKMIVFHIGDSRLYIVDSDKIQQITKDHSLVQRLVDEGRITKEEASVHPNRNILLKALGSNERLTADVQEITLNIAVKVVLCSDGLTSMLRDKEIEEIVRNNTCEMAVDKLILSANKAGGTDNITVIVFDAGENNG